MRVQLVLLAILGVTLAKTVPQDGEDVARQFLECVRKALDGGLESAQIPDHNPLHIWSNLTFPIDVTGLSGVIKVENAEIDNIVKAEITNIVGESVSETEATYNVDFFFDHLILKGDYSANFTIILFPYNAAGPINMDIQNLTISVVWNQNPQTRLLNDFQIKLQSDAVVFTIEGLGGIGGITDIAVSEAVSLALHEAMNHGDMSALGSGLKNRFNTLWLDDDHWFRIDAIIDNCKA